MAKFEGSKVKFEKEEENRSNALRLMFCALHCRADASSSLAWPIASLVLVNDDLPL